MTKHNCKEWEVVKKKKKVLVGWTCEEWYKHFKGGQDLFHKPFPPLSNKKHAYGKNQQGQIIHRLTMPKKVRVTIEEL